MNLEFVKDLWVPNIFIYNLKTYKEPKLAVESIWLFTLNFPFNNFLKDLLVQACVLRPGDKRAVQASRPMGQHNSGQWPVIQLANSGQNYYNW